MIEIIVGIILLLIIGALMNSQDKRNWRRTRYLYRKIRYGRK